MIFALFPPEAGVREPAGMYISPPCSVGAAPAGLAPAGLAPARHPWLRADK